MTLEEVKKEIHKHLTPEFPFGALDRDCDIELFKRCPEWREDWGEFMDSSGEWVSLDGSFVSVNCSQDLIPHSLTKLGDFPMDSGELSETIASQITREDLEVKPFGAFTHPDQDDHLSELVEKAFNPALDKRKDGKVLLELFETGFPHAVWELSKVMTWAAEYKGYKPNDWKNLPEWSTKLQAAAARHRVQRLMGIERDDESDLLHLVHECFNLMAMLELTLMEQKKIND